MNGRRPKTAPDIARWALALVAACLTVEDVHGDPSTPLLSEQRWQESEFGLSIREPNGAERYDNPADGSLVRFVDPGLYNVSLDIRTSEEPVELETIKTKAIQQFSILYPSSVLADDPRAEIRPAGRPGMRLIFVVPDDTEGDWMRAQVFTKIDPFSFAMLQMEFRADQHERLLPLLDALIDSMELEDPEQLDRQRKALIEMGEATLATLREQDMSELLEPERWYRIVEEGRDVGYARVTERQVTDAGLGLPGVRITRLTRIYIGRNAFDTKSEWFESVDGTAELWSIRTTQRDGQADRRGLPPAGASGGSRSWAETGLRSDDLITVSRETPTSIDRHDWQRPETAYVSQVALRLLPRRLRVAQPLRFGFYAYDSGEQSMTLNVIEATPLADGGVRVSWRPTVNHPPRVSTYDAHGRLVRREMPDGRAWLAADRDQVLRRWAPAARRSGDR